MLKILVFQVSNYNDLMLLLVAQCATSGTDGPYLVFICPILPPMDKFSDVKLGPTSAELGIAMSQLS